jgi:uncharacterized protein YecT (DUF1311 family)
MFSSTPEIDGDSPNAFNASYEDVFRSSTKYGLSQGVEISTKLIQFYLYAKGNTSVTQADYDALLSDQSRGADVMLAAVTAVNSNPEIQKQFMEYLDGMSAADIFDEREDIEEDIADLLKDRPITASSAQVLPEEPHAAEGPTDASFIVPASEQTAIAAPEPAVAVSSLEAAEAMQQPTIPPSFDCTGAVARVEQMICSNDRLSDLDNRMAVAYAESRRKFGEVPELIASQREWVAQRNACTDAMCVENAYDTRLTKLANVRVYGNGKVEGL